MGQAIGRPESIARGLTIAMVVGAFALFAINLHLRWQDAQPSRRPAAATPVVEVEADQLRVRAWFDRSHVTVGEQAAVWVVLENRSARDVAEIRFLRFLTPGFAPEVACWRDGPACPPGASAALAFPRTLKAGSLLPLQAVVRANRAVAAGSFDGAIAAVVDGKETVLVLSVGPATVSAPPTLAAVVPEALYGFFKDVGLTLMLGVLALLFQAYQQRRAQVQETWSVVFPRAHETAVKYLLPIVGAASGLVRQVDEALDGQRSVESARLARRRALFNLVDLFRSLQRLGNEAGGYVLSDTRGEEFLYQCWASVRKRLESALGFETILRVLHATKGVATLVEFESQVARPAVGWEDADFAELRGRFEAWLAGVTVDVDRQIIDVYRTALEHEANTVYERWYPTGQVARQAADVAREVEALRARLAAAGEEKTLQVALEAYLERLRR
ncbi:MAG: hypothetical protein U0599_30270 [Vicinamibacteria bacterium]